MVIGKAGGRVLAAAITVCLMGWLMAGPASAGAVPNDVNGFTDYAAKAYARALLGGRVTVKGPLLLTVQRRGHDAMDVDLHTNYRACQLDPGACETELARHVRGTIENMDETPVDPAAVRAVVRTKAYVDEMRASLAPHDDHPVVVPLAGDLWLMCVLDRPDSIAYVGMHDLSKLGLTEQQLVALARRNTSKALGPLSRAHHAHEDDVWLITDNAYESSRFLEPKRWASLAKRLGGLAMAMPAPDVIVYGDDKPKTVVDLALTADNIAAHVPRPLSTAVYRWSPDGWQLVLSQKVR